MRKPLSGYKAVFFDAGDTLLTIPEARILFSQFLALKSFHNDEQHVGQLLDEAFNLFYYGKQLNPEQVCSPESDRKFWMDLYRFILDRLGAGEQWSEEEIYLVCHELYDEFIDPKHYQLFEDVKANLERFRSLGLRMAVISNFAPTLATILREKEIMNYFDAVIVSTEVGLEKPNPAIFRLALEQTGLAAEDVLYVGDHENNDIWAPAQVGMDAVKISRYTYQADGSIHSLNELT
ncbi:HAD family hydrolase [Gorillibacterium massiliense]|uniref:HAD family hydrolase n=1 Tax=Gorillibacterium massiliense TaxID=1280390 RepID=UPI0004B235DD|nr:HAD-IA family hydrolase [Gorillibacterium massiliense]